jgi:hypothetical protein
VRGLVVAAILIGALGVAHADRFCASPAAVDLVTTELVCPEATYRGWSLRRTVGGWAHVIDGTTPTAISADEATHIDQWLTDGVAQVCAGKGDPAVEFPSLHRKEYGWPLDRCRGRRENRLVLGKGALRLALSAPRAPELAALYLLARLHDLGRRMVWPAAP